MDIDSSSLFQVRDSSDLEINEVGTLELGLRHFVQRGNLYVKASVTR